jgi:hypothetical protein
MRSDAFAEQRRCSCALARRFPVSPRNPFRLIQHLGEDFARAVQAFPSIRALTRQLAVQIWGRVTQTVGSDAQCAPMYKLGASVKNNDFSKPPFLCASARNREHWKQIKGESGEGVVAKI